jgi:hypothetical protein
MDQYIYAHTHGVCVCEQGGCDRGNARGMGGRDLGASAGTQSHAQQSRAAPLGRRVAVECAAEPRRHPSLVQRRFLPLKGLKGGTEGVLRGYSGGTREYPDTLTLTLKAHACARARTHTHMHA